MDSIEQPETAPPMVMVLNSGTTMGTRPLGSVACTRSIKVTPGSAVHVQPSTSMSSILFRQETSILSSEYFLSPGLGTWWLVTFLRRDSGRVLLRSRSSRAMRATSESCCSRVTVLNFIMTIFPFCTEDEGEGAESKRPLAHSTPVFLFVI